MTSDCCVVNDSSGGVWTENICYVFRVKPFSISSSVVWGLGLGNRCSSSLRRSVSVVFVCVRASIHDHEI